MSAPLASLVDQFGPEYVTDPARVRKLLHSALAGREPEISLLVIGAEAGIATELAHVGGSAPSTVFSDLTLRLVEERGMALASARWVVDMWAWALGANGRVMPASPAFNEAAGLPLSTQQAGADGKDASARRRSIPVALMLFVLATVVTMVVLSRNGPIATNAVADPLSVPLSQTPSATTVSVPSLVSMPSDEAIDRLVALGLGHRITTRSTDEQDPGVVLRQHPAPGTSLLDGAKVTLVVAAPPRRVGAPTGLSFERSPTTVTITWDAPTAGSGVDHYEIWRDGVLIGERAPGRRTYTDAGLFPGTSYLYGVKAVGYNGTRARSRSRTITLPFPPASPSPTPAPDTGGQAPPPPPPPPSPSPSPCPAPDPKFCS